MTIFLRHPLSRLIVLALLAGCGPGFADSPAKIGKLVEKYCYDCHADGAAKGNIDFDQYPDVAAILRDTRLHRRIIDMLESAKMPPEKKPQPSSGDKKFLVAEFRKAMANPECSRVHDPGPATIHRLNREEYNNTIRDLFGLDLRPADQFPLDDTGYGFDNIADVLSISPLLTEKYLAAAESIINAAIVTRPASSRRQSVTIPGVEMVKIDSNGKAHPAGQSGQIMATNGVLRATHHFPVTGEYIIRAHAWASQAGTDPAQMELLLNNQNLQTCNVTAKAGSPQAFEKRIMVQAGTHSIDTAFTNDYYDPKCPDPTRRDRNLAVERVEIDGPFNPVKQKMPPSHSKIFFCDPGPTTPETETARAVIGRFAIRAYRRPIAESELSDMLALYDVGRAAGDTYEGAVALAIQGILVSPHFLFRVETQEKAKPGTASLPLSPFELASRLSYFLWSSMPDDTLFALAQAGTLTQPKILQEQTRRMLKDPKADAFVHNFAGQWLLLRNLDIIEPDPEQFPTATEPLRHSMRQETELFFNEIVRSDRSILDVINGRYTYVDNLLAKHYGIPGKFDGFQRVDLPASRGGVLGQASMLTVTSNPSRTSPVKRGRFVLDQLLGLPPPPPPGDIAPLDVEAVSTAHLSLRKQMELHRDHPECASCHMRMDPIGFAFEHFDAIGRWRDKDGSKTIDTTATLPDGNAFDGVDGLRTVLKQYESELARTVTEKLLTYALGRGIGHYDDCTINDICKRAAADNYRFSAILDGIVTSDAFCRKRPAQPQ